MHQFKLHQQILSSLLMCDAELCRLWFVADISPTYLNAVPAQRHLL